MFQSCPEAFGQFGIDLLVGRQAGFNHVGRHKGGEDRDGDDDGVEVGVYHIEAQTQSRNDERELTNLAEAEAALHGRLQRLAAQRHANRGGHGFEDDDRGGNH